MTLVEMQEQIAQGLEHLEKVHNEDAKHIGTEYNGYLKPNEFILLHNAIADIQTVESAIWRRLNYGGR
jgi:hypothetical protein